MTQLITFNHAMVFIVGSLVSLWTMYNFRGIRQLFDSKSIQYLLTLIIYLCSMFFIYYNFYLSKWAGIGYLTLLLISNTYLHFLFKRVIDKPKIIHQLDLDIVIDELTDEYKTLQRQREHIVNNPEDGETISSEQMADYLKIRKRQIDIENDYNIKL